MTIKQLNVLFRDFNGEVEAAPGRWKLTLDNISLTCFADEMHNRMRVMSFIIKESEMKEGDLKKCMEANFYTTLDAHYALYENWLVGVFVHPLKELTPVQLKNGISHLYSIVKTYGSTFVAGDLKFPTRDEWRTGLN